MASHCFEAVREGAADDAASLGRDAGEEVKARRRRADRLSMRLIVTRPQEDAGRYATSWRRSATRSASCRCCASCPRPDVVIPAARLSGRRRSPAPMRIALRSHGHDRVKILPYADGRSAIAGRRQACGLRREPRRMAATSTGWPPHRRQSRSGRGPVLYLSGADKCGRSRGAADRLGFAVERVILYDAVPAASLERPGTRRA